MATSYRAFRTYAHVNEFLGNKADKTVKPNVRAIRNGDDIEIWLYNTVIVRYFANGRIVCDHGGFETVTTFRHIAGCSPFCPYKEKKRSKVCINGRRDFSVHFTGPVEYRTDAPGYSEEIRVLDYEEIRVLD
jgi:hypothetical protein